MATAGTRYRRVDWRPVILVAMVIGISAGFVERGCYQDRARHPQLSRNEYDLTRDQFLVNQRARAFLCGSSPGVACHIHCLGKNSRYFAFRGRASGTQTLSERCYCINEPPGDPYPGRCNYSPCGSVNSGGALDGVGYASVYKVFDTDVCFQVPEGIARTKVSRIPERAGVVSPAGKCRAHCLDRATPFFGIRAAGINDVLQCHCLDENTIDFPVLTNSSICNKTCDEIPCGGNNRYTSIYTVCPPGYKVDSTMNQLCALPCECPSGVCHVNGTCVVCPRGWTGHMCQDDLDECTTYTHNCTYRAECRNTHGGFECVCLSGYSPTLDHSGQRCTDIDECAAPDNILCEHGQCVNTDGAYVCTCDPGYDPARDNRSCSDVDECTKGSHNCRGTSIECRNTPGSYECVCPSGYNLTESRGYQQCSDIDECYTSANTLCEHGQCENTDGSFYCDCDSGYERTPDRQACTDVDECTKGSHNCLGTIIECRNTPGSYECVCESGYNLTVGTYYQRCTDIDECNMSANTLCEHGRCRNTGGSFYCICDSGYERTPDWQACTDADECTEESDNCRGTSIECRNTPGSFECVCESGYSLTESGSYQQCTDIDECNTSANTLCEHGRCENTNGSFHCDCDSGYERTPDRQACTDVDECETGLNECPEDSEVGTCRNTDGGYTCDCTDRYQRSGTGLECVDRDECLEPQTCLNGTCYNTPGLYYCTCDAGYQGAVSNVSCVDVDECDRRSDVDLCGNGTCQNTEGSYTCSCHHGYTLNDDGPRCQNTDECLTEEVCANGECEDLEGSYQCLCNSGYTRSDNLRQCFANQEDSSDVTIPAVVSVLVILAVGAVIATVIFYKRYRPRGKPQRTASRTDTSRMTAPTATVSSSINVQLASRTTGSTVTGEASARPRKITIPGATGKGTTKINIINQINQNVHINIERAPKADQSASQKPKVQPKPRLVKQPDPEDHLYGNVGNDVMQKTLFDVKAFLAYVKEQKKEEEPFKKEYGALPEGPTASSDAGALPQLKMKNRFKNILPYDENRVKLTIENNDPLSDYINASYIQGYNSKDQFIAALGPRLKTIDDFWRMVWEKKCHVILMLTNLIEDGVSKCDKYWPDSGTKQFGPFTVRLISIEERTETVTRKLGLSLNDEEGLTVTQIHFTMWPDHGVPRYCASLLRLQGVLSRCMVPGGYTLVHCSAGVGRTGSMIAIDYLLKQAQTENHLDVFSCVKKLREQRVSMVQTWQQYVFVYNVLAEYLTVGETCFPSFSLTSTTEKLAASQTQDGESLYITQHKLLTDRAPYVDVYDTREALNKENKQKNRDISIVPQSSKRPHLKTEIEGRNDYINAVTVNAFNKKDAYIATQIPLESTVADFWRLVVDYKANTVVVLATTVQNQDSSHYLPTERTPIEVKGMTFRLKSEQIDAKNGILSQTVAMTTAESAGADSTGDYMNTDDFFQPTDTTIRVLTMTQNHAEVIDGDITLDLITKVLHGNDSGPIIVTDMNGCQFCGQFIACSSLIEMINSDKQIDVFHTVQLIKDSRPQFINTLAQYKHLFAVCAKYIGDFDQYGNVYVGF